MQRCRRARAAADAELRLGSRRGVVVGPALRAKDAGRDSSSATTGAWLSKRTSQAAELPRLSPAPAAVARVERRWSRSVLSLDQLRGARASRAPCARLCGRSGTHRLCSVRRVVRGAPRRQGRPAARRVAGGGRADACSCTSRIRHATHVRRVCDAFAPLVVLLLTLHNTQILYVLNRYIRRGAGEAQRPRDRRARAGENGAMTSAVDGPALQRGEHRRVLDRVDVRAVTRAAAPVAAHRAEHAQGWGRVQGARGEEPRDDGAVLRRPRLFVPARNAVDLREERAEHVHARVAEGYLRVRARGVSPPETRVGAAAGGARVTAAGGAR